MPKRKRHQPGRYKDKPRFEDIPNFTGVKPLTVFQADNGLWGAKGGDGTIEIPAVYQRIPQNEEDIKQNRIRLGNSEEVIGVTPDDWDLIAYFSLD